MCKRDFARHGAGAATHEGHVGDGVVRGAEGAMTHESGAAAQIAGHGVNFGGLQSLPEGEWRQNGWQPLRHHGFARTGRTYEQNVVAAGACHLKCAFHTLLPFHIGEIVREIVERPGEILAGVDHRGRYGERGREVVDDLAERPGAVDLEIVDHGGLAGVLLRHDESLHSQLAGKDSHGEHPGDGEQRAVERKLAHDHIPVEQVGRNLAVGGEDAHGQRQVVGGALFPDLRRCHVDEDFAAWKFEGAVVHGALHALDALLHSLVGHPHKGDGESRLNERLDGNPDGVDALQGGAANFSEHVGGVMMEG